MIAEGVVKETVGGGQEGAIQSLMDVYYLSMTFLLNTYRSYAQNQNISSVNVAPLLI